VIVAGILALAPAARATILDFTDLASFGAASTSSAATGTIGGVTWTLAPVGAGSLSYNFPGAAGVFAPRSESSSRSGPPTAPPISRRISPWQGSFSRSSPFRFPRASCFS
jgi:hypothetical protein